MLDGVTISRYQVDYATNLARHRGCANSVRFHLCNMLRTGVPPARFDGVVTNETTMYVDLVELYREFARVLRSGGRYALITWCVNDRTGPAPTLSASIATTAPTCTTAAATSPRWPPTASCRIGLSISPPKRFCTGSCPPTPAAAFLLVASERIGLVRRG